MIKITMPSNHIMIVDDMVFLLRKLGLNKDLTCEQDARGGAYIYWLKRW
jgi:hypothetical protein